MPAFRHRHALPAFLVRHRATLALAVVLMFTTAGTAAAVSYLVLGSVNTAASTTTLRSGVNGAVVQLTNTNTAAGISARGLGIAVPAGRAPLTVNASAGKATNLDADKLDGLDSTKFARGTNVKILANRRVLDNGESLTTLLEVPGLGVVVGSCPQDGDSATIYWQNSSGTSIDLWMNSAGDGGRLAGFIVPAGSLGYYSVSLWYGGSQNGETLILGTGNDPGARKTATVTLAVYRSAVSAPCGVQATAILWSTL
jgi:hypothetical protein